MRDRQFHGEYYNPTEKKRTARIAAIIIGGVITIFATAVMVLILSSCASPGKMVGTGYVVSVQEKKLDVKKFENLDEADWFIFQSTGIPINSINMIGERRTFYELRNGDVSIYVEKKGIYQKKHSGKEQWRIYNKVLPVE